MNYLFHEEAEKDLLSIVEYYEECQIGLGLRFSKELYVTIDRICKYPLAWKMIDLKTRRCLMSRFPFGVLYRIVDNRIIIMAIMHLHRKPGYWKNRIL